MTAKRYASTRPTLHQVAVGIWALVLTALTWPTDSLSYGVGVDEGTIVSFHLWPKRWAAELNTHAPLDLLFHPKALNWASLAFPFLFLTAWTCALVAAIYLCLRTRHGRKTSLVITSLVLFLLPNRHSYYADSAFVMMFSLLYLFTHYKNRFRYAAEFLGFLASIMLFTKVSLGVYSLAAVIVFAIFVKRSSLQLIRSLAAFVVGCMAIWAALGESPGSLPRWLFHTSELVSGFTPAFGLQRLGYGFDLVAAAFLLMLCCYLSLRSGAGHERIVLMIFGCAAVYLISKETFTRDNDWHIVLGLGLVPAILVLQVKRGATAILGVGIALAASLAIFGTYNTFQPQRSLVTFGRTVAYSVDGTSRSHAVALYKQRVRSHYRMPDQVRSAVGRNPVTLTSYDPAIAWAYGLNWDPAPVWQVNLAYTPALDRLNANFLAVAQPYVLWSPEAQTDDKARLHQNPSFYYQLLCSYRPVAISNGWQVLAPSPNRCSDRTTLSSQVIRSADETIAIPQPLRANDAIVASYMQADISTLKTVLFQATKYPVRPYEHLNGVSYPINMATGTGPLLLNIPHSAGWTRPIEGLPEAAKTLSFGGTNFPVTVTFSEVSVNPDDSGETPLATAQP